MLDYPSIAALAAVIREGTFERGAAALGITPSAISQRVRGLEERLGTVLIIRGNPCEPTELGQTLCAHLDRVRLLEFDIAPALGNGAILAGTPLSIRVAVNADSLATWLPAAIAAFARNAGVSLEVILEDETHTADRLRSGEVMAAVTAASTPIQGCRTSPLGALRYTACASPDFMDRQFPTGVTGPALARAPMLRFDRKDLLQHRWAQEQCGVELVGPTHWVPSAQGFIDLALRGVGWGLQPSSLVEGHIAAGRLVELRPARPLEVQLFWTVARLHAGPLQCLSDEVKLAARDRLTIPPAGV